MKRILGIFFAVLLMCFMCVAANAQVYYVSSTGTASNSGTTESVSTTFASVYSKTDNEKDIIVVDDMTYIDASSAYSGKVIIKGKTSSVNLTLPSTVSLKGDLEIDNINLKTAATIYANGKHLKIGSSTTSIDRLTVYGGSSSVLTGDTYIELMGGKYKQVYGGCNAKTLSGNTNVIFGGSANNGDGINDQNSSTISPCYVYGGGNNGAVTGSTRVTLQDSAVTKYIVGTGSGANGTSPDANVFIKGGKVMNVYGAAAGGATRTNCNAHIIMTGGLAESLFGGCENASMTGNTYVDLFGGNVSRRVYTGCYNDWKLTYQTKHYVTGTTTLRISPNAKVNTKTELDSGNSNNVGVFSGSRYSAVTAEYNTLIFLDDSYNAFKGQIGDVSGWGLFLKSNADYTVKAGSGGKVYTTGTKGQLYIEPDKGYCGVIGSNYYINETASISSGTTEVTYSENLLLKTLTANVTDDGILANVGYVAKNVKGEKSPQIIVSVFDNETKRFVGCDIKSADAALTTLDFNVAGKLEPGKNYTVKAMLWSEDGKVLADEKIINIQ